MLQTGPVTDLSTTIKAFALLAVFGGLAAKLVLDWSAGRRPFHGGNDDPSGWLTDDADAHHGGWCDDGD